MQLIEDADVKIAACVNVGSDDNRAISIDNKDGSILPGICAWTCSTGNVLKYHREPYKTKCNLTPNIK
jgi:hypothetical protein